MVVCSHISRESIPCFDEQRPRSVWICGRSLAFPYFINFFLDSSSWHVFGYFFFVIVSCVCVSKSYSPLFLPPFSSGIFGNTGKSSTWRLCCARDNDAYVSFFRGCCSASTTSRSVYSHIYIPFGTSKKFCLDFFLGSICSFCSPDSLRFAPPWFCFSGSERARSTHSLQWNDERMVYSSFRPDLKFCLSMNTVFEFLMSIFFFWFTFSLQLYHLIFRSLMFYCCFIVLDWKLPPLHLFSSRNCWIGFKFHCCKWRRKYSLSYLATLHSHAPYPYPSGYIWQNGW